MLPFFKHAIGTWSWGNTLIWDYGIDFTSSDLSRLFTAALAAGNRYFFTNESFSDGRSEEILGTLAEAEADAFIATKFQPRPWRFGRRDFEKALAHSLKRLRRETVDLYLLLYPKQDFNRENHLQMMAECAVDAVDRGQVRNIGVSDFPPEAIEPFAELLKRYGVGLSAVAGEYNLLNRAVEENGTLAFCRSERIPFLAESPLAMGLLTGKYLYEPIANGVRRNLTERFESERLNLLIHLMNSIGAEYRGKDSGQVALNWINAKGAIPVAGAKTVEQAEKNRLAFDFKLTDDQITHIQEFTPARNPERDEFEQNQLF